MKIQFIEPTWVVESYGGGFAGIYNQRAVKVDSVPIEVINVDRDKKKQCSRIFAWSDGHCDGQCAFWINVPNGLFKILDGGWLS